MFVWFFLIGSFLVKLIQFNTCIWLKQKYTKYETLSSSVHLPRNIDDEQKQVLIGKEILVRPRDCVELKLQLKTRFFYIFEPIEKHTNLCHFAILLIGLIQ